jgi:2-polyprenyl-3-methyl-5-hydroxy-6-metoxy-1,4-benzoquinol methylase
MSHPPVPDTVPASAPRALRFDLHPLRGDPVDIGLEEGARMWLAKTCDPAFLATPPAGTPGLAPGWYRVSIFLDGRSGNIDQPQIYVPDMHGAHSEERVVPLEREGDSHVACFFTPAPIDHLRLDPSRYPCQFACDGMDVTSMAAAPVAEAASMLSRARAAVSRLFRRGGRQLARQAARVTRQWPGGRPLDRNARVLAVLDRRGVGIEIGPSHDPIAPKREGFNVQIIDHATREELREKYAAHNVAHERIEEVDFVWRGQSYLELTGKPKHYDWIIASHLIEHTPDLIAFLADCDSILKDDGVLALVIPDKRHTFDHFRPITGLARLVDSHLSGNTMHSAGALAEHYMNVVSKSHRLSWNAGESGDYIFIHSAHQTKGVIREAREKASYRDIHNWCFVPHSFRLLMSDLYALGYTRLREVWFHPTEGCEFYVALGRHGRGPPLSRLELLQAIDAELGAPEGR